MFADTDDPTEDGIVLVQSPGAGIDAAPGDTITLTAGRFVAPPTTDTTTTDTTTTPDRAAPAAVIRVAVLMGGRSSEHDISVASARSVIAALDPARYETVTVEIGRDGGWELGAGSAQRRARDARAATRCPCPRRASR